MNHLTSLIDHTLLKVDATSLEIEKLCLEAMELKVFSVCVNPIYVDVAKKNLLGTSIQVGSVVGFPLGANLKQVKLLESSLALKNGADELDVVMNLGYLKESRYDSILDELKEIKAMAAYHVVKVIIETPVLTESEKRIATELVIESGCDFVKTSTGFFGKSTTVDDVVLLRKIARDQIGVKASGGIKDLQTLKDFIRAGASRIGCSQTKMIFESFF